jgi:lipopolysaccharide export system protein LptA
VRALMLILTVSLVTHALAGAEAPRVLEMGADVLDVDQANQRAEGHGNVWAKFEDATLTAEDIRADLKAGTLLATGDVKLKQRDGLLTARELDYDLNKRAGSLQDLHAQMGPVLFSAEKAQITPEAVWGTGAVLTTCDRPHPHYRLTAGRIMVGRNRRAVVSGAALWWHERRLLRLPQFKVPLPGAKGRQQGFLPRTGYSSGDGPFVGLRYGWITGRDFDSSVELRQTVRRGTRGIVRAGLDRPWGRIALALASKEDLTETSPPTDDPQTGIRRFLVDKVPELRADLDSRKIAPWLTTHGYATVGTYLEHETGARASRAATTLFLVPRSIGLGGMALEPGIAWRGLTAGGERQTVLVSRIALRLAETPTGRLHISYQRRKANGISPFAFDVPEIERELTAEGAARFSHGWGLENTYRYDLDQHRFRDAEVIVSRTAHCLRYSAVWRKARKEFLLQVGLSAF